MHAPARLRRPAVLAALALAALLGAAAPAFAHPMGNFSINHYSAITVSGRAIQLLYIVDLAEIPTYQELSGLRADQQTGRMTAARHRAYLRRKAGELTAGLAVRFNNRPVALRLRARDVLFPPGAGGLPTERLYLVLDGVLPRQAGTVQFSDSNFPGRAGWKEIVVRAGTGERVRHSSIPATSRSRGLTVYPGSVVSSPPQDLTVRIEVAPLAGTLPASLPPGRTVIQQAESPLLRAGGGWSVLARGLTKVGPAAGNDHSGSATQGPAFGGNRVDALSALMSKHALSFNVALLSLLIAFWFGAGHALSPGHGKTIVAAYLVGSRGTAAHAALLGATVTVTHTAGVFALGFVTLSLSRYVLPDQLYPWLGFLSGLLVALMGLTLFVRRLQTYRRQRSTGPHFAPATDRQPVFALAGHFGSGVKPLYGDASFRWPFRRQPRGEHRHETDHIHSHDQGEHTHDHSPGHPDHHIHEDEDHTPEHVHHRPTGHAHSHGRDHVHGQSHGHGHSHEQEHDADHYLGHSHDSQHDRAHDRPHTHDSNQVHLIPHRHGLFGRTHTHGPIPGQDGEPITMRSLIAIGVSGGLLPCPSALVVLLSAIAFHRLAFGMVLIVAFSLGLASTLTGVGILVVYGRRLIARLNAGRSSPRLAPVVGRAARVVPIFSALAVAALGTVIALGALGPGMLPALLVGLH